MAALAATAVLISVPMVQAGVFTGFTMDFVDIGNIDNAADDTGSGAVGYNYRISMYEVSRGMIAAYNIALDGGPDITLFDLAFAGGNGANRPASGVSWNEAARFVNWLNTSTGSVPAYNFTTGGANDNIALWQLGDSGYDASNRFRNSNARYFLPSEDEWYKAAFYNPNTDSYYEYATGSDIAPLPVAGGTVSGTAVYNIQSSPADITNAGGLSPYGTMAQNGNVWEWTESAVAAPNNSPGELRVFRGGYWGDTHAGPLQASIPGNFSPSTKAGTVGFRVASSVPEPSRSCFMVIGVMGFLMKRRRG